jgi:hypothetical protein
MVPGNKYEFFWSMEKAKESKVQLSLKYNNTSLIEGLATSGADIDGLFDMIENEADKMNYKLLNKANATLKLMDNLVFAYIVDLEKYAKAMDNIYEKYENSWSKASCDAQAKAYSDYMKIALVSLKENYKIADVIMKVEKDDEWDEYYLTPYLKFNDQTMVEMDAYFSKGFDKLMDKWEDFLDSFN